MRTLSSLALLMLTGISAAQELTGALPLSVHLGLAPELVPTLTAAPFDAQATALDDAQRDAAGKLQLYARFVAAEASMASHGVWTELPGGDRVWRLRVISPGAHAIELLFEDANIPAGAQLHVYDDALSQIIGGFTGNHVQADGTFTTDMVYGESCTIEYHEPATVRGEGSLNLKQVAHAYRNVLHLKGSDACEVDVNCSEGANWVDQRDAVVRIRVPISGGYGYCTGTLMNNTANDCKGYILTAFHCTEDATSFTGFQFAFRFQKPGCETGSGTAANMNGCVFRAGSHDQGGIYGSDYSLVELTAAVPPGYTPYWAGWDVNVAAPSGAVSIHHPAGDVKKISTVNGNATSSSFSGFTSGSHWRVTWAATANGAGVTEGGSSGSPLFNSAKRVVGTLTGGASACVANGAGPGTGPQFPDYYGKMDYHWWENNPNPTAEELHWWLAPVGFPVYQEGSRNPCAPIGIEEVAAISPEVFPNPARDRITVRLPQGSHNADRIDVADLTGRAVHSEWITSSSFGMDLSEWAEGSYVLNVLAEGRRLGSTMLTIVR